MTNCVWISIRLNYQIRYVNSYSIIDVKFSFFSIECKRQHNIIVFFINVQQFSAVDWVSEKEFAFSSTLSYLLTKGSKVASMTQLMYAACLMWSNCCRSDQCHCRIDRCNTHKHSANEAIHENNNKLIWWKYLWLKIKMFALLGAQKNIYVFDGKYSRKSIS